MDLLFPPKCLICGSLEGVGTSRGRKAANGRPAMEIPSFCERCTAELVAIHSPICPSCGLPFVSREGTDHYCQECLTEHRFFRKARAFGVYCGALMRAIHVYKYGKKAAVAKPLGLLVRDCFNRHWRQGETDLLLAVPLHRKRLRERGFNQARLLVSRWAEAQGLRLEDSILVRRRMTEPQTGLPLERRKGNVKGVFNVERPESVKDKRILIVDDVYTTGATANECARVLKKAGAEYVDVLTLAKAL